MTIKNDRSKNDTAAIYPDAKGINDIWIGMDYGTC